MLSRSDVCTEGMDVKERRPYCSLTKSRREKERRYTNSSADNDDCRVPTQKSYSSSETLKAFDHDSSRLLYGNRTKDLVHREADEYSRQGRSSFLKTRYRLTGLLQRAHYSLFRGIIIIVIVIIILVVVIIVGKPYSLILRKISSPSFSFRLEIEK